MGLRASLRGLTTRAVTSKELHPIGPEVHATCAPRSTRGAGTFGVMRLAPTRQTIMGRAHRVRLSRAQVGDDNGRQLSPSGSPHGVGPPPRDSAVWAPPISRPGSWVGAEIGLRRRLRPPEPAPRSQLRWSGRLRRSVDDHSRCGRMALSWCSVRRTAGRVHGCRCRRALAGPADSPVSPTNLNYFGNRWATKVPCQPGCPSATSGGLRLVSAGRRFWFPLEFRRGGARGIAGQR